MCAVTSCTCACTRTHVHVDCACGLCMCVGIHVYYMYMFQLVFNSFCVFSRSWFLVPFVHTVVWYFALDSVAMFWSFSLMRDREREPGLRRQLGKFFRKKWSFLLHHMLIFAVAYPLIVVSCLNEYFFFVISHSLSDMLTRIHCSCIANPMLLVPCFI